MSLSAVRPRSALLTRLSLPVAIDPQRAAQKAEKQRAFFSAIEAGDFPAFERLCDDRDVDINAKNEAGLPALMVIREAANRCAYPTHDAVDKMVKKLATAPGVDLEATDNKGNTALIKFVYSGNRGYSLDLVKFLVNQGAQVHAANNRGKTVLMSCAQHTGIEGVNYLLSQGANAKAVDRDGFTAFNRVSSTSDKVDVWTRLYDAGAVLNKKISQSAFNDLFNYSCFNHDVMQWFLSIGVDVNAESTTSAPPLITRARFPTSSVEHTLFLLENKANPNLKGPDGKTPLMIATKKLLDEAIAVKTRGAGRDLKTGEEFILLLIKYGANLDPDTARLLLEYEGDTPLAQEALKLYAEQKDIEAIGLLKSAGLPVDDTELIRLLKIDSSNVNQTLKDGNTLLTKALPLKNISLIKTIFGIAGVDIQKPNERGETPLMCAIAAQDHASTERLLELGANVRPYNDNGRNALMHAVDVGLLSTVRVLVDEFGARVDATDPSGKTVLDLAMIKGNRAVVEFLKSRGAVSNNAGSFVEAVAPVLAAGPAAARVEHGVDEYVSLETMHEAKINIAKRLIQNPRTALSYQEIADAAGVSLDDISAILAELN